MKEKNPSVGLSIIPLFALVILLCLNVYVFSDDSSYGPNQIALFLCALLTACLGHYKLKLPYKELEKKALSTISSSMQATFILLIVGAMVGVWILNGVVPAMIYYGIQFINPSLFLPVALIICSIVSVSTGSSWTTAATVGIALIGIGNALQYSEAMVAGAIVSGAYFGDKMSPLSDTTNLAPAMAGGDLFGHIKHMLYTTVPAVICSFIIFAFLGLGHDSGNVDSNKINQIMLVIEQNFNITPALFLLPVIVFLLVKKKMSAIPALSLGTILGVFFAIIFQADLLEKMSEASDLYKTIMSVSFSGFEIQTGNEIIDKLFNRGGMSGMLNTIWLILMAMFFGGMLEATGMLMAIAQAVLSMAKSVGSLVASTIASGLFLNITASDQYISLILTGRMFRKAYKEKHLAPENLSRAIEDGGTVTSALIPWNTCGAYFATVLGVATFNYVPFALFNILCPVFSIAFAYANIGIKKVS